MVSGTTESQIVITEHVQFHMIVLLGSLAIAEDCCISATIFNDHDIEASCQFYKYPQRPPTMVKIWIAEDRWNRTELYCSDNQRSSTIISPYGTQAEGVEI